MLDFAPIFPDPEPLLQDLMGNFPKLNWQDVLEGQEKKEGTIHASVSIGKNVSIGQGSKIDPFVVIEDDVIIGQNVHIRSGVLIRSKTVISDHVVIGHGSEVKASYLSAGVKIGSHCFIGDSLLGKGARVGSGTMTANRRFDQKSISWQGPQVLVKTPHAWLGMILGDFARLGANCTTNPGTVICAKTWISSGQVVQGFIATKQFVKADGSCVDNSFDEQLS